MDAAALTEYVGAQDTMSAQARAAMQRLCDALAEYPADVQRDVLLDLLPPLADTYGDAAAELAARWYEEQRTAELGSGAYTATTTPQDTSAAITSGIRTDAGALYGADGSINALANRLAPLLDMLVRDAFRTTVMDNIARDPAHPGWARFAEPDACGFCIMVASQGSVYGSKTAAGGHEYHRGCRCVPVPCWGDVPTVVRTRIDECTAMWDEARANTDGDWRDVLSTLRQQTGGH